MKALIIGSAGFVGGHLITKLLSLGHTVYATHLEGETVTCSGDFSERILDIMDINSIKSVLSDVKPDVVYHLAAQSSVALSWKKPQLTADINIKGTLNILETIKELEVKPRLIMIGSAEEYGFAAHTGAPISEHSELIPGNIYAVTKAAQNMLGNVYYRAYGLDIVMVRAFNHMGPGQAEQFVVADFCKQAAMIELQMMENTIKVGNLTAKRDFTDVRDVVSAYAMLAEKGKSGELYNIGTGNPVAIQEILDMIVSMSKADIKVTQDPKRMRPSDVPIICPDISKLVGDTGWKPAIPLNQTVADTLDYWRHRLS